MQIKAGRQQCKKILFFCSIFRNCDHSEYHDVWGEPTVLLFIIIFWENQLFYYLSIVTMGCMECIGKTNYPVFVLLS